MATKPYRLRAGFTLTHPTTKAVITNLDKTGDQCPLVDLTDEDYSLCAHMVEEVPAKKSAS